MKLICYIVEKNEFLSFTKIWLFHTLTPNIIRIRRCQYTYRHKKCLKLTNRRLKFETFLFVVTIEFFHYRKKNTKYQRKISIKTYTHIFILSFKNKIIKYLEVV